ncbi:MAG: hypothetical protein JWM64_733 [Frankiales bacterium]|nr:hypothetical protein [Frankiales bacterium]
MVRPLPLLRGVLLLSLLAALAVAVPPSSAAPGTMMTFSPNAVFTGGTASTVATSRSGYSDVTGTLTIRPAATTGSTATYRAPVLPQGPTGNRWDVAIDLRDPVTGTPAAPGLYDAEIEVDGGVVESCTGCFTVLTRSAPGVASSAGLAPRRVVPGEALPLVVTGTSFADGTAVEVLLGGKPDPLLTVTGSGDATLTRLTRDLVVDSDAPSGYRDVRFTNTDGRTTTCLKCLTVTVPAEKVEPTGVTNDVVRSVRVDVPGPVPPKARLRLTWVGAGAPDPARDLTATTTTVTTAAASTLTGTVDFTGATPGLNAYAAGYVLPDGSVHDCDGLCRFTVRQPAPPVVTSLKGLAKATTAVRTLTLTGTGFTRGTTVVSSDELVTVTRTTWTSPTAMTVVVRVDPAASGDPVVFDVANPDGQTSSYTTDPLEPGPPGPPVPVVATEDGDPDPSRGPETPSLVLPLTVLGQQQTLHLTGRADAGTALDLFATTCASPTPRLVKTVSAVADDGTWSVSTAPTTRTQYVAVSRNSFGRSAGAPLAVAVRTLVTLAPATRLQPLQYRFAGTVLPRRSGVRVDVFDVSRPKRVLLGRSTTRPDGSWSFAKPKTFLKAGTLKVLAATPSDCHNAAGTSAVRQVAVR